MARTSRLLMKLSASYSLVAKKGFGLDLGGQRFGLRDVVSVATGETERQWIAQRIDDYVDFCRKAAA